jgi:hypothetical protein
MKARASAAAYRERCISFSLKICSFAHRPSQQQGSNTEVGQRAPRKVCRGSPSGRLPCLIFFSYRASKDSKGGHGAPAPSTTPCASRPALPISRRLESVDDWRSDVAHHTSPSTSRSARYPMAAFFPAASASHSARAACGEAAAAYRRKSAVDVRKAALDAAADFRRFLPGYLPRPDQRVPSPAISEYTSSTVDPPDCSCIGQERCAACYYCRCFAGFCREPHPPQMKRLSSPHLV